MTAKELATVWYRYRGGEVVREKELVVIKTHADLDELLGDSRLTAREGQLVDSLLYAWEQKQLWRGHHDEAVRRITRLEEHPEKYDLCRICDGTSIVDGSL